MRQQIARLPPYPALLVVAGPLAVVEPLKLATVFIAGEGHWITSGLVLLFSLCREPVCHALAVRCGQTEITHLAVVRVGMSKIRFLARPRVDCACNFNALAGFHSLASPFAQELSRLPKKPKVSENGIIRASIGTGTVATRFSRGTCGMFRAA